MLGHIGILAVNPSLYANLQYHPLTSFTFVAPLALVPNVLAVNPKVPVHSIAELIAYAKANPGQLNFPRPASGGAAHIAMAAFNVATGTRMVHVPYRGTPPSITDVISGQVQATFTSGVSLLPHVRSGALRALGFGTPKRIAAAPDIPAIAETVPGFEASSWYGIVAPAGTPDAIVQRLYSEIRKAMASPEIARRLNNEGAEHWDVSPEEFRNYVAAEIQRWKGVIEAANIRGRVARRAISFLHRPSVLIVGGGPVGLTLAMDLASRGIDVTVTEIRARRRVAERQMQSGLRPLHGGLPPARDRQDNPRRPDCRRTIRTTSPAGFR